MITGYLGPNPDNATITQSEYENAVRNIADGFVHPVGTAAMSADGKSGVVDKDLKVKGVRGLRIVDASVIVGKINVRFSRS